MQECPICNGRMESIGEAIVLRRYPAIYLQCQACGFSQVENPFWLEEAYSSAITSTDIGYATRCELSVRVSVATLGSMFGRNSRFLDYGGGYGLFTRMMRDRGFDFVCHDPYCDPLFARGSVATSLKARKFDAVTCFEVFEHLPDPVPQIDKILDLADTILLTTYLISQPAPPLRDWWYYNPNHGQHVSFFTKKALHAFAAARGLKCHTNGRDWHLLTSRAIPQPLFRLLTSYRVAKVAGYFLKRPSFLSSDYESLLKTEVAHLDPNAEKPAPSSG
jgi:Methyltransferase domain